MSAFSCTKEERAIIFMSYVKGYCESKHVKFYNLLKQCCNKKELLAFLLLFRTIMLMFEFNFVLTFHKMVFLP